MNTQKPILCCSDVHGCGNELAELIAPFVDSHSIYLLGDAFDRGFHGVKVWELIHQYSIKCLMGNHESKMLSFLKGESEYIPKHYSFFLNEFCKRYDLHDLVAFLEKLPVMVQLDEYHLGVHAAVNPYHPLIEDRNINVFGRFNHPIKWWNRYHLDSPIVIYGHEVHRGHGARIGYGSSGHVNSVGLDTGAVHGRPLTGLEINNGQHIIHQVSSQDYFQKMKALTANPSSAVLKFRENEIRKNTN